MATPLAQLGAAVCLASRNQARRERAAAELGARGLDAALRCDVTQEAEVSAFVGAVAAPGRVGVIVCNAGGASTATHLQQGRTRSSPHQPAP